MTKNEEHDAISWFYMTKEESEQRHLVVCEAMTWLGTPYVACGDVKKAGVDCGMLLVRTFVDVGVVEPFDPRPYSEQWALHGDREMYLELIERFCKPVTRWEDGRIPKPGDIVLFRIHKLLAHGVIVTDWPNIIHSINGTPVTRDNIGQSTWMHREHHYFTLKTWSE